MKTLTFTLILLALSTFGFAQNRQADSLKHELAIAKADTSRVLIIAQLCNSYRNSKPDSALFFGEKGMALAEKINFPKGMVRNTNAYGHVLRDLGNVPKSMAMQFKALQMAKENNLLEEIGRSLQNLGGIFFYLKEYSKALVYYKQAKIIFETYPSSSGFLAITLYLTE
jgi:two-component system, NtrC family, sensor kinase